MSSEENESLYDLIAKSGSAAPRKEEVKQSETKVPFKEAISNLFGDYIAGPLTKRLIHILIT